MRRFLIATATTRHRRESGLDDRPELLDERTRMVALFQTLGYTTVAGFGENLATERWLDQLRGFLSSPQRRPDDIIVVYHTGHGLADGDNLLLPMADTAADPTKAVWVEDLTSRLLRGTHIRRLLIVLDTCHSAVGGAALAHGATAFLGRLRGLDTNPAVAVIVSARPTEEAEAGAFTQAFAAAVAHRATGGVDSPYLPLDGVVDVINATTPGHQHARLFYIGDTVAEFLPNPRYDPHLRNLDLWAQDRARQREARRAERRDHVLPRAQGIDTPATQDLWLYAGRHHALRHVCNWLDQPTAPPTMIITGDPGSGKSALLARLFVLARTDIRGRVPNVHTLPADTIPPVDVFTEFIHARGQTPDGLLTAIAHACGLNPSDTVSDLVTGVRTAHRPVVLIIDAVDEAAHTQSDGFPVVDQILAPLVRAAASRDVPLRLLLGTRRHLIEALGQPAEVLNLDADEYADLDSLRDYAVTCLTRVTDTSPYRHQPRHYLDRVAGAIAQAAGRSFLVALITARSLALQSHLPDPDNQTWRANLPTIPADAMRADLATRLGPDADTARALLLPLAYAEGNGLPWKTCGPHWPPPWPTTPTPATILTGSSPTPGSTSPKPPPKTADDPSTGSSTKPSPNTCAPTATTPPTRPPSPACSPTGSPDSKTDTPTGPPHTPTPAPTSPPTPPAPTTSTTSSSTRSTSCTPHPARYSPPYPPPTQKPHTPHHPPTGTPCPTSAPTTQPRPRPRTSSSPPYAHAPHHWPPPSATAVCRWPGPPKRRYGRPTVHTRHSPVTPATCCRWRWGGSTAATSSSPAATTGRCECGTRPPAPRSGDR